MVGRTHETLFPVRDRPSNESEIALEVSSLSAPPLLKSASFKLRRGEILGIAGLMGSGRTPLLRAIFGLQRSENGSVVVKNKNPGGGQNSATVRLIQGLGYLSEDRKGEGLNLNLSVADNTTQTKFSSCSRWGWIDLAKQQQQTRRLIELLKIKVRGPQQTVQSLSGGNQQKVALARLLHQDADVLLLDEPTRGIDIGSKAQVYKTIAECAAQQKAVVMVSSYLPELFGMCDRLAVMSRGKLSPVKPIEEWTPESVLQTAIGSETDNGKGQAP
jgi:ribose transport system ATP-binding protein